MQRKTHSVLLLLAFGLSACFNGDSGIAAVKNYPLCDGRSAEAVFGATAMTVQDGRARGQGLLRDLETRRELERDETRLVDYLSGLKGDKRNISVYVGRADGMDVYDFDLSLDRSVTRVSVRRFRREEGSDRFDRAFLTIGEQCDDLRRDGFF